MIDLGSPPPYAVAKFMRLTEDPEVVAKLDQTVALSGQADPGLQSLPLPARRKYAFQDWMFKTFVEAAAWEDLITLSQRPGQTDAMIAYDWLKLHPDALWFSEQVNLGALTGDGFLQRGGVDNILRPALFELRKGAHYQIEDELLNGLRMTKIGADVPCDYFRLPHPEIFVEFGAQRDLPFIIPHRQSGDHVLEGVYLKETEAKPHPDRDPATERRLGLDPDKPRRVIEILFIGSPKGKRNLLDDSSMTVVLQIQPKDEQTPLLALLEHQLKTFTELQKEEGMEGYSAFNDYEQACLVEAMELLVKSILYMNTASVRWDTLNERRDLEDRLSKVKSSGKRAKLLRKLQRSYDRIIVRPPEPAAQPSRGKATGRTVQAHFRSGYLRLQPYGPKRSKRKLKWIPPVLVNPGQLPAGQLPAKKKHIVR